MVPRVALAFCALSISLVGCEPAPRTFALDDDASLLQTDAAAFHSASTPIKFTESLVDPDLVWTDSSGGSWNKSQILPELERTISAGKDVLDDAGMPTPATKVRSYGQVGIVQENSGKFYVLRIWVKRAAGWRLLVYQAVRIGAPPAESEKGDCENPCKTVPFEPRNQDEADVIHAYQAVERAVTASDSKAWGVHIADEFFAVTSNSDRPLDKATRMAGLNKKKVGGIAPFPLASARMFEFGDAMVMISEQQPLSGHRLHVKRVWFKRNGEWLEAYSYQTTIQAGVPAR